MNNKNYRAQFATLLTNEFIPAGYTLTKRVELDPVPESAKYNALVFSLDDKHIVYRNAKVTQDRPGAFLTLWQRPSLDNITDNKPIPLSANELDYLFIQVVSPTSITDNKDREKGTKQGMFIFPVSVLMDKGIVASTKKPGKTGFRVFPPWSQDRGVAGTKVFSASGKKTQRWQLPYFLAMDENGCIDRCALNKVLDYNNVTNKGA